MDLFHAREHLHDLARSLEFMLGDQKDDWLAARLEDLDYGDIDGICNAARVYPLVGVKKDALDTALGNFENNAPRMRYHWFRSRGLFVGSGAVEAGCKSVIGQRLKQFGMHWTSAGADAIITRRATRPAASGKPSAANRTTRQEPPDQPAPKDDHDYLQNCRAPPTTAFAPVLSDPASTMATEVTDPMG